MGQGAYPPRSDTGFPARVAALAKAQAIEQMKHRIGALWPAARLAVGLAVRSARRA
jgi:hypothetical protein